MSRYLALPEAGQQAVRSLMTALEAALEAARTDRAPTGSPPFAQGGVLPPGKPYLVGERP